MKRKNIVGLTLITLLFSACEKKTDLENAEWLLGTWQNKLQEGDIYERWKKIGDDKFSGRSFMVNGKDTLSLESIELMIQDGKVFYVPIAKGQNNDEPVRFTARKFTNSLMQFENLEHDFPKYISYRKINDDSLIAEISGMNGEQRQEFAMRRVEQ